MDEQIKRNSPVGTREETASSGRKVSGDDVGRDSGKAAVEADSHAEPDANRGLVLAQRSDKPRYQVRSMQDREFSMILKTRGRALSQALMTIAGTKQRSGRLWLTAGAMFLVIALLIVQVYYRHREVNLGYELSSAIARREALLEENRKLRIELRVLSRRERLEPLAGKQLGMSVVRPEQVYIRHVDASPRGGAASMGGRPDGLDNVRRVGEE